jgi:hypothetical protein
MSCFHVLNEGWLVRRDQSLDPGRAGGARCVTTSNGDLICVFVSSAGMGRNDLTPMLTRSVDGGSSWSDPQPLWPSLTEQWSILAAVSADAMGQLLIFGSRCRIDEPDQSFWNAQTQGLKNNELIWSRSIDNGETWLDPRVILMPTPGAAEAPNPMCVTPAGRYLACYSPYATFDATINVDRSVFVAVYSDDRGATWQHSEMMRFAELHSGTAMGAVAQLADGPVIGAGWHLHLRDNEDFPTPYALSDDGTSWHPHRMTGIRAQSVSLTALADSSVLMPYVQRRGGSAGVWMALARPSAADFGLVADQVIWRAETATGNAAEHAQWQDFSFGSPAVVALRENMLLVTFWIDLPQVKGIRYMRLAMAR